MAGGEGTPPWETPAEPEAAESETATDSRYRFPSEGFWFAAMLCVLAGGYWAWHNWMILAKYSAAAEGRRVAGSEWGIHVSQPGPDGLPREGPSYAMAAGPGMLIKPAEPRAISSGAVGTDLRPGCRFATTPTIRPSTSSACPRRQGNLTGRGGHRRTAGVYRIAVPVRIWTQITSVPILGSGWHVPEPSAKGVVLPRSATPFARGSGTCHPNRKLFEANPNSPIRLCPWRI